MHTAVMRFTTRQVHEGIVVARILQAMLALALLMLLAPLARAQEPLPSGILASGDGVITGFSGHVERDTGRFINAEGISAKILPLPSRPLAGQVANPVPKLEIPASRIGQVFGVAIDSFPNPNVYLGATSAYGLHIVADTNGDGIPEPITKGRPGAQWMEGQFGPGGGPGTIWRVDGTTGEIAPFATIPDTVVGIGNLAIDPVHFQLFASDLDSGLIYRIDLAGNIIDTFDHGVQGRQAAGLPPVADDGKVADIESPAFDVNNANTWGFTDTRRRVWGLAYHRGRLYYAVADGPQIWSVGINFDGSFANDARVEIMRVPGGMPVSDILFTPQGWMIVAQRGFHNGDSTFVNFHIKGTNQVIRYRRDPRTGQWTQIPEPYAIGLTPDHTYASGGVGLSCGGVLWSSGDNLREDPLLLAGEGAPQPVVHGLQGNDVRDVRPANTPPFNSIFIDYDGKPDNPEAAGHVGDVEVYRDCRGAPAQPGWYDGGWWYPPVGKPGGDPGVYKRLLQCVVDPEDPELQRCTYGIWITDVPAESLTGGFTIIDTPAAGISFGGLIEASLGFECSQPGGPGTEVKCSFSGGVKAEAWLNAYVFLGLEMLVPRKRIIETNYAVLDNCVKVDLAGNVIDACTGIKDEPPVLQPHKEFISCEKEEDGDGLLCKLRLRVTNPGPVDYVGPLHLEDAVGPGVELVDATSVPAADGWTCAQPGGAGTLIACDTAWDVLLPVGNTSGVDITVRIPDAEKEAARKDCLRLDEDGEKACITIPDKPRLTLDKEFGKCEPHGAGYICSYTITITNIGAGTYTGPLNVTDNVGPDTAYFGHDPADWTCNQPNPGDPIACTNPGPVTLDPGASTTLTLRVSIPGEKLDDNRRDCAIMEHDGEELSDCATIEKKRPKLVPEKESLGCIKHEPGDDKAICTFRLTVRNTGDAPFNGVATVTDLVGPGVAYVDHTPAADWTCSQAGAGNPITCNTNAPVTLNPSDATFVDVRVTVPVNAPAAHTDCAIIEGGEGAVAGGAHEEACVTVDLGKPDLDIRKTNLRCVPLAGTHDVQCIWRITVRNNGTQAYTGVLNVTDLPAAGTYVSHAPAADWNCVAGPSIQCQSTGPVTLNPGNTRTLDIVVRHTGPFDGPIANCATLKRKNGDRTVCTDTPPPPPPPGKPKLKTEKEDTTCTREGETIRCTWTIRITNTGTAPTSTPLVISDVLPVPGASVVGTPSGSVPWSCTTHTTPAGASFGCTSGAVLNPGQSATLQATFTFPASAVANQRQVKNCAIGGPMPLQYTLRKGKSGQQGGFSEFLPQMSLRKNRGGNLCERVKGKLPEGFSCDCGNGDVPPPPPPPPSGKPKLERTKDVEECRVEGEMLQCTFIIKVRNVGNAPFNGFITVQDIPTGGAWTLQPQPGSSAWQCSQPGGAGASVDCKTRVPAALAAGAAYPVPLYLTMQIPLDETTEELANCVRKNDTGDERDCVNVQSPRPEWEKKLKECERTNDGIICTFTFSMRNAGSGPYVGRGSFVDMPVTGTLVSSNPPAGWSCVQNNNDIICNSAGDVTIAPGGEISGELTIRYPDDGKKHVNCWNPYYLDDTRRCIPVKVPPRPDDGGICPRGTVEFPNANSVPQGFEVVKELKDGRACARRKRGKPPVVVPPVVTPTPGIVDPKQPEKPKCRRGERLVPSKAYALKRGWPVRKVVRGGKAIWCAIPKQTPRGCPKGWISAMPNPDYYRERGWKVRLFGNEWCMKRQQGTRFCREGGRVLQDYDEAERLRRQGWNVDFVRGPGPDGTPYWCVYGPPPAPVCPQGWQQLTRQQYLTYRKRGWPTTVVRRGQQMRYCGKPGDIPPPQCPKGTRLFPSSEAVPSGYEVVRKLRNGQVCAKPVQRPQCPTETRQVSREEAMRLKRKGVPVLKWSNGKITIWCAPTGWNPPTRCPKGWKQVPSRDYAVQRGWPVRFIRVPAGPAAMRGIWCAKPVVRPQCPKGTRLFPSLKAVPRGYEVVRKLRNGQVCAKPGGTPPPQCPKGWRQLTPQQVKLYRARQWPVRRIGKLWCGKPGDVPPPRCPKDMKQLSREQYMAYRKRGWPTTVVRRGKRILYCGRKRVDGGGGIRNVCRPPAFRSGRGCACPKGFKPRTVTTGRARITTCVRVGPPPCPKGMKRVRGQCVRVVPPCPPGFVRKNGKCGRIIVDPPRHCPKGMKRVRGRCVRVMPPCPKGTVRRGRACVRIVRPCPKGMKRVGNRCVKVPPRPCPKGTVRTNRGVCVPVRIEPRLPQRSQNNQGNIKIY